MMSDTRNGSASMMSVARMTMSSNRPPFSPAIAPTMVPRNTEINPVNNPIISDTRAP